MKDEKTLLNEIKEQCGDCKAWSGTDCTRNPYTKGCLKDEKQVIECHGMLKGCEIVKQAVKDTAKEIFAKVKKALNHLDDEWEISNALYPLEQEYLKSKGVELSEK